jgi:hypothetical protein
LHLHIGDKFSAPDLLQTFVHRRKFRIGQGIAASSPRFDLGRSLDKLFLVFLRPGSGLFQQFFKSEAHGRNIAYFDFAATPRSRRLSEPADRGRSGPRHPRGKNTRTQRKTPGSFLPGVSLGELSDDQDQKLR